ncbi:MAG: hypothetical protein QOD41_3860 [Cryptosporangiaceae bacterium]|nr:hypothetical protein [Cryptosporangiaceae bacterium]
MIRRRKWEGTTLSYDDDEQPDTDPAVRLREEWLAASIEDGWADAAEWHQPEVDALIAAVLAGADPLPAAGALAGQRCIFGVTLDETLADLAAFVRLAPQLGGPLPFGIARAAAAAWYRASVDPQVVQPCRDAMTGLATETHLVVRAAEVYQEFAATGGDPRGAYELLVLAWDPHQGSSAQIGVQIRLAGLFQRSFVAGQTIAQVGQAAIVVLSRRDLASPEAMAALDAGLDDAMAGGARTRLTRWPFPGSVDGLTDLLVSLHGSADRDVAARWRDAAN